MQRVEALSRILNNRAELSAMGVAHLSLYGSVARDQAGLNSDVDVVVDTVDGRAPGLFVLARVAEQLERILGRRVDIISKRGLDHAPALKRRVSPDLLHVF